MDQEGKERVEICRLLWQSGPLYPSQAARQHMLHRPHMNRRSCSSQRWTGLKTHRSEVPGVARKLSERCFSCVDRLPTYPSQKCFESILKHILADFSGLQARISIKLLHSRHFWKWKPDSDSLPRYASQNRIAAKMALHMIAVCLLYIGFRARDTATICFADAARIRVKSHSVKDASLL